MLNNKDYETCNLLAKMYYAQGLDQVLCWDLRFSKTLTTIGDCSLSYAAVSLVESYVLQDRAEFCTLLVCLSLLKRLGQRSAKTIRITEHYDNIRECSLKVQHAVVNCKPSFRSREAREVKLTQALYSFVRGNLCMDVPIQEIQKLRVISASDEISSLRQFWSSPEGLWLEVLNRVLDERGLATISKNAWVSVNIAVAFFFHSLFSQTPATDSRSSRLSTP